MEIRNRIDLHTHTSASDGICSPEELIDRAIESGIHTMAITDHDTVGGLKDAIRHARSRNFSLIPGIEFSVDYSRGSFHLVGLYIDHTCRELVETADRLREIRETRAWRIIEDLKLNGVDIPLEEVVELAAGASLGKPHFARVMIKHGYAGSMEEVFRKYLVEGKPGDVKKEKISLDAALRLIRKAGGIAVIAHPVSLEFESFEEFDGMLPAMMEMGLEGIEAYAYMHSSEQVDALVRIGRRRNLLITGGSDYHGEGEVRLGYYGEGNQIPSELIYDLEKHRDKKQT